MSSIADMIAERNGRKTLTTVQGIPAKFDHKKILKVIKKEFGMFAPLSPPIHIHSC
jgi:translation initiation factor 1 (eIF-1/SUI1)